MRILLLTRSYPRDGDLYQYPFVHRRVKAYLAAGHEVEVCRLSKSEERYSFDGVACQLVPPGQFAALAASFGPDVIAAHGLDEHMWPALESLQDQWPVCAWLHGSEIPSFFRTKARCIIDEVERERELERADARANFWRTALNPWPRQLHLCLVSQFSIELLQQDLGSVLRSDRIHVIPNPIDTDLFGYHRKDDRDRFHILSIRPYDSATYGNDLAVNAVNLLADHPLFPMAQFTFIGDGPLFESVLRPLRDYPNVSIKQQFLKQEEIAFLHLAHGIFLVPTRLDTQGVSRDEAMSSGLVPVTNAVCSIPEYADANCAILAARDDAKALAAGIADLWENPSDFLRLSEAAAQRVRGQSDHRLVIPRELAWMASKVPIRLRS